MTRFEEAADFAVKKAVLFATLAIVTTMMGMAFDFALSARAGAWMSLVLSALLLWFATTAHRRRPERTETWMLLPDEARPLSTPSRQVFCTVMRDTYARYAAWSFAQAVLLFAVWLALSAAGLEIGFK
jgi:hypothetical protein